MGEEKAGTVAGSDEAAAGSQDGKLVREGLRLDGVSNNGGGTAGVLTGLGGISMEHADNHKANTRKSKRNGRIDGYSTISFSTIWAIRDEGFGQSQDTLTEKVTPGEQGTHLLPG
jgi:hypothetical protein